MAPPCIVDASVLLNLGGARGLHVLIESARYAWKITPIVRGETRHADTRHALERAIIEQRVELVEIDTSSASEMSSWQALTQRLDPGEAEAIALSISRGWFVALEDRKGQRVLTEVAGPGRWINCANLLLDAIEDRRLAIEEADELFCRMSCYPGYERKGVTSLRQLMR